MSCYRCRASAWTNYGSRVNPVSCGRVFRFKDFLPWKTNKLELRCIVHCPACAGPAECSSLIRTLSLSPRTDVFLSTPWQACSSFHAIFFPPSLLYLTDHYLHPSLFPHPYHAPNNIHSLLCYPGACGYSLHVSGSIRASSLYMLVT